MSQAPFSIPDADTLVGSTHVLKKHGSLNKLLGKRRPKAKVPSLVGIVAVALLLVGSLLTACGNAASSTGSASNTPPLSNTSTSKAGPTKSPTSGPTNKPTAGPTQNPKVGPTTVPPAPTADPTSFTVSEREFDFTGSAGQSDPPVGHITISNSSKLPLKWRVSVAPNTAGAWLKLNPSSGNLVGSRTIDLIASNLKAHLLPGSYVASLVWSPVNPQADNSVKVTLTVVPSVSKISPASGPAAGGTSVTITGVGFTGATGVSFGSTSIPASSYTVDSDTQITAISPAGNSGPVDVTVTDSFGPSALVAADKFTYLPAPTVSGISPASGPAAGGTNVTITGVGFTGATSVKFGSTSIPASSFISASDTQIKVQSPPGTGTVDVTVTTPNGTSATGILDRFTYT